MAKKKDALLLLLAAGGALLLLGSGKAKASTPKITRPIEDEDLEPHGTVTPLDDELRVVPPSAPMPEGSPVTERPVVDPMVDAARAAASAVDAQRKLRPLYPDVPRAPSAAQPDAPLPSAQAPLDQVPAPSAQAPRAATSPLGPNLPAGYAPESARRGARSLAAHLKRAKRSGYDRRLLEQWQRQAGLVPDRLYGGSTRGALLFYGVAPADAPQPFFPPLQTVPFVPPEQR